jgi:phosphoribosylamine--glycine ligase/phosphoribosylformylglycinamidine cyclo-ligase
VEVAVRPGYAVAVVLASKGYPGNYDKGKRIEIEDLPPSEYFCCIESSN